VDSTNAMLILRPKDDLKWLMLIWSMLCLWNEIEYSVDIQSYETHAIFYNLLVNLIYLLNKLSCLLYGSWIQWRKSRFHKAILFMQSNWNHIDNIKELSELLSLFLWCSRFNSFRHFYAFTHPINIKFWSNSCSYFLLISIRRIFVLLLQHILLLT
jgi:hypothetical protein